MPPSTIDSYYTSLVAHDMASGALAPRKPKYGDPDYLHLQRGAKACKRKKEDLPHGTENRSFDF